MQMAQGSANFLLTQASEHIGGETELLTGVHNAAELIKSELELMKEFLRFADAVENSDERFTVMVRHVTELAYKMEDTLDDYNQRVVRDPRHGDGKFDDLAKLAFAVKTLGPRHRIASQLRSIRNKLKNLRTSHEWFTHSVQLTTLMNLRLTSTDARSENWPDIVPLDADLVGIDGHKDNLIARLLGDGDKRYVVSVVGMGGLGKSTLAMMVYDCTRITMEFTLRAWITVSLTYQINDLLNSLFQQLCEVLNMAEPQELDNRRLRRGIYNLLNQRRYLIVLDDVWDTKIWEVFEEVLPNNNLRSRVLFTTRKEGVAFHSCQAVNINMYALTTLSAEHSRTLFDRKLFNNDPCPPHLQEVTNKFLGRCEGLPLAIVAIGGALLGRDASRLEAWVEAERSLGTNLENNDRLVSLKNILSLSYKDLPYYLKSCLLYLSIFPPGNTIERMMIIRLLVAEGFVEERENSTQEEVADSYLNELIQRSLVKVVEVTNDGRIKTCRIHDILREIMVSKAKAQLFAAIFKDQDKPWSKKARRLSIHEASANIKHRRIGSGSRLRSLLMFWGMDHSPESPALKLPLQRTRFLSVLHLEGAPLTKFPRQVVNLFLLKYLSLRGTKVDSIPSSIEKLQNIETLDMKHTLVTELPVQILKLQKLRHLLVYRYVYDTDDQIHIKCGFKSPIQIGKLQSIQKLCFLEAGQHEQLLVEIGKLRQLRRLGIVKLKSADGAILCSSIDNLTNLRALSVTAESNHKISMDHLSSPPRSLQRLYLTGRLEKLPDWISNLHSLAKLVLKLSKLSVVDPLEPLQELPNLVHLALMQAYDGESLCFELHKFQRLRFLGLNRLERLNNIVLEEGAVTGLEKLVVHSCNSLHNLPVGIEQLTRLKELEFFDMPKELAKSLRGTDKINHERTTVNFVDKNDGYLNLYDFKP